MNAPVRLLYVALPGWCTALARTAAGGEPPSAEGRALDAALDRLPSAMAADLRHYVQPADRARGLAVRLLLRHALAPDRPPAEVLAGWTADAHGRPWLPGAPVFNASHAAGLVGLALREGPPPSAEGDPLAAAPDSALGLDLEALRRVDFGLLADYMTGREWADIRSDADPTARFHHYWTAKEAVMKAEGLGFRLPLADLRLTGERAAVRGRDWHLHRLDPPAAAGPHAGHLATREAAPALRSETVEWSALLHE